MKKNSILFSAILLLLVNAAYSQTKIKAVAETPKKQMGHTLFTYKATDIAGKEFDFSTLKGKKVMVVNTASKCGYTPQYAELEKLYQQFKDNGFIIIGFPSNDFGKQEPGTNEEISTFCQKNYGVTFPMMGKIAVTGNEMHPVYKFLTQKSLNEVEDSKVEWNFQKYLIDEKGELVHVIPSKVSPTDASIISWIKGESSK